MPNDTPPSPPGPPEVSSDSSGTSSPASSSDAPPSEIYHESEEAKEQREHQTIQMKQRHVFLLDLLKRFDSLIYAELAFLYYLEASLPRFLVRVCVQLTLLTPTKIPPPFPGAKPYVQSLLISNIICMLLHYFCDLPEPIAGARGYLNGGVWPDFIGQRPPTSRLYLLIMDVFIMAVQFFMLAVNEQRDRVKKALSGRKEMEEYQAQERGEVQTAGEIESGDLEAAERGEVGRAPQNADGSWQTDERRPLMPFSPSAPRPGPSRPWPPPRGHIDPEESETEERVYGPAGGPLDEFMSGNLILGEFHVIHTFKDLYSNFTNQADRNLMAAGYTGGVFLRRARNGVAAAANAVTN